jgi:hypothetical protein
MAACLIFNGLLKIISRGWAENTQTQGKQPFSDVHGHFRDNGPI